MIIPITQYHTHTHTQPQQQQQQPRASERSGFRRARGRCAVRCCPPPPGFPSFLGVGEMLRATLSCKWKRKTTLVLLLARGTRLCCCCCCCCLGRRGPDFGLAARGRRASRQRLLCSTGRVHLPDYGSPSSGPPLCLRPDRCWRILRATHRAWNGWAD